MNFVGPATLTGELLPSLRPTGPRVSASIRMYKGDAFEDVQ
jgi:hypothetical protein